MAVWSRADLHPIQACMHLLAASMARRSPFPSTAEMVSDAPRRGRRAVPAPFYWIYSQAKGVQWQDSAISQTDQDRAKHSRSQHVSDDRPILHVAQVQGVQAISYQKVLEYRVGAVQVSTAGTRRVHCLLTRPLDPSRQATPQHQ